MVNDDLRDEIAAVIASAYDTIWIDQDCQASTDEVVDAVLPAVLAIPAIAQALALPSVPRWSVGEIANCEHCTATIRLHENGRWYHAGGWPSCSPGTAGAPLAAPGAAAPAAGTPREVAVQELRIPNHTVDPISGVIVDYGDAEVEKPYRIDELKGWWVEIDKRHEYGRSRFDFIISDVEFGHDVVILGGRLGDAHLADGAYGPNRRFTLKRGDSVRVY